MRTDDMTPEQRKHRREQVRRRNNAVWPRGLRVADDAPITVLAEAALVMVESGGSVSITKDQLKRLALYVKEVEVY